METIEIIHAIGYSIVGGQILLIMQNEKFNEKKVAKKLLNDPVFFATYSQEGFMIVAGSIIASIFLLGIDLLIGLDSAAITSIAIGCIALAVAVVRWYIKTINAAIRLRTKKR